ncbi:arrestin domain-containing protein 4-like [Planococcus citri]|uniref:arrestin domain-containing protein 4-like n=1 Tax=Planococcus citri TaxID=170843 RepID=UPI0031F781D8
MRSKSLTIVFDSPDRIYLPGGIVKGRVEIVLHSELNIRGVKLKIIGEAKCEWMAGKTPVRSREIYLNSELTLVGGTGTKLKLPVGQYSYPFTALLPSEIPSSLGSTYGEILYYMKAKIDIPFAFDYKHEAKFFVLNLVNLNLYPSLRTPYSEEKSRKFWFLRWKSGPLTMVVHLPKTGFCSSERIPFTIKIDNASDVAVRAIHVHLKRKLKWTAGKHYIEEKTELQKLRFDGVREGQSNIVSGYCSILHDISFPNLEHCSIIHISHELHIVAESTGAHLNLHIRIPITIGDIPLSEDRNFSTSPENTGSVPSNDDSPSSTSLHNIEQMPQISADAQRYPRPNYPGVVNPSPKRVVRVQEPQTRSRIAHSATFVCSESTVYLCRKSTRVIRRYNQDLL